MVDKFTQIPVLYEICQLVIAYIGLSENVKMKILKLVTFFLL